jgi:hypothetical protein
VTLGLRPSGKLTCSWLLFVGVVSVRVDCYYTTLI